MLSRRSVRIKAMQMLYAFVNSQGMTPKEVEKSYISEINTSYRLYLYNVLTLQKVLGYAEKDLAIKSAKYIRSEEDEAGIQRLYENGVCQSLVHNVGLQKILKKELLIPLIDQDLIRKLYREFIKGKEYCTYKDLKEVSNEDNKQMVLKLYKSIVKNELAVEHFEDHFPLWDQDLSLVMGAVKKSVKSLLEDDEFYLKQFPDEETVKDFGQELLYKALRFDSELDKLIEPKLQNWEMDRVAVMDLILLKLALTELLHFPTIPTKVTINEYIDLAKNFSTPKSKDFVNGVLDRLMKELEEAGRIEKNERGLS